MAKRLNRVRIPVYLITDRVVSGLSHARICRLAMNSGIRIIQLREKLMSKKELHHEALALRSLTRKHQAIFIVNDYIDIALSADADGVHLGQEDMPLGEARKIMGKKKIIGISTHSLKQALAAEKGGADYIGFGPLFHTSSKDAGSPKGLKALRELRKHIKIPIVAIGGISSENILSVLEAGADTVALMSAVLKGDIKKNTANLMRAVNKTKQFNMFH
jgi:thiamine-phosphate pyrophosphorylase